MKVPAMKPISAFLMVLLFAGGGMAQNVRTQPLGFRTTVLSGSIAVTDTFQSIQVANSNRVGCTVQNKGTHDMWVYFGPMTSATENLAVKVASGLAVGCATVGGIILQDQVSITGTSGDLFSATFQ